MIVTSPCVNVCKLDSKNVCVGCFRTREEIAQWMQMTEAEKASVILELALRRPEFVKRQNE